METMTKKEKMYARIEKHGANLNRIFQTKLDNVTLCKKLFTLEHKAHKLAEDYCNGLVDTEYEYHSETAKILDKVNGILGNVWRKKHVPVFVNGDPRGYALKIESDYVRDNNIEIERDWGGYGLLAPDFNC